MSRQWLRWGTLVLLAAFLPWACGCRSATEAVVDGFYGGISDTVAAVISGTLLGESA